MRVAVIGSGVVGLATASELLGLGAEVICYEQANIAFDARSRGDSRIFRIAHSTPDLADLAVTARAGYQKWSERAGRPLVGSEGCLVSGSQIEQWASALATAGQPSKIVDGNSSNIDIPVADRPSALLLDEAGGVIDVRSVGAYLMQLSKDILVHEHVYAIEESGSGLALWTSLGKSQFDGIVIAAGAGTSALAAQVGIYTPPALAHHARFSFRLRRPGRYSCWLNKPEGELGTYQHQSSPTTWSVGGHLPDEKVEWTVGREQAVAASREAVVNYASEKLDVDPTVVESLYCTTTPDLGDGFRVLGEGRVLAIYGENLFKLAPVIGSILARQVLDPAAPVRTDYIAP